MQAFFLINIFMGLTYIKENKELIRQYQKEYQKEYRKKNKEKQKEYQKEYREKNKEKLKNYFYAKAKDKKYIEQRNAYIRSVYASDLNYRLKRIIRSMVSRTCKTLKVIKSSKSLKYVGCTPEQLKQYIESKFKPGMSWDNHGVYGWHLDHIKPISKFSTNNVFEANHYTNLQPLWAKENLSKHDN